MTEFPEDDLKELSIKASLPMMDRRRLINAVAQLRCQHKRETGIVGVHGACAW